MGQTILWGVPPPSPRARFDGAGISAMDLIDDEEEEDLASKLRPGAKANQGATSNTSELTRHLLVAGML